MSGNKIKVSSPFFYVYLIYTVLIWGSEAADCFSYVVGLPQTTVISRLVIVLLTGLLIWWSYKRVEFSTMRISRSELAAIAVIFLIGFFKSVYPDSACDTHNYHLVAQRSGFVNHFTENFAKGNFQVWGFRLGDRLFFLFRQLLGYRLGTMLNTFVLMIMYLQVYGLLGYFADETNKGAISRLIRSRTLWAFIIVMMHDAVLMIGIYYVDILALPFALEVLDLLIRASQGETDKKSICYFALLNGIWFAFKMTNIVFVAPCVIMYIVLVRKKLSVATVLSSGLLAALPCSVYLVFNFAATGNPVYPYFNGFFQSEYFRNMNFKDTAWGGTNLFEKLFWPLYLIFKPEYRQFEIPAQYNFLLLLGLAGILLVSAAAVIRLLQKNHSLRAMEVVTVISLASTLFWSFSTGYERYFLFGMILLGIAAYYLIVNMAANKWMQVVSVVLVMVVTCQTGMTLKEFYSGREWSWNKWEKDTFAEQCTKIFKDRLFAKTQDADIDMFFLTDSVYSGYAEMYDPDIYTYVVYDQWLEDSSAAEEALREHKQLLKGNVYDISRRLLIDIDLYIDKVNGCGMYIESMDTYASDVGSMVLVKLKHQEERKNTVWFSDEKISIQSNISSEDGRLSFICGRVYEWETSPKHEIVISKLDNSSKEEIFRTEIDNLQIKKYQLSIGRVEKNSTIQMEFYDLAGNEINREEINKYFVVNPVLAEK